MDARWLRISACALAMVGGTAAVAAGQLRQSSVADHTELLQLPHPSAGSGESGENAYIRCTDDDSTFMPAIDPPVGGCCLPDAPYCEILSVAECAAAGGGWLGDGSECDLATDCNDNGYLDACECAMDCDGNGIPDECDIRNCCRIAGARAARAIRRV